MYDWLPSPVVSTGGMGKRKPRNHCGFWVFEVLDEKQIISWRTVGALRKHAGGMFLASTAAAMPRGPHISSKKVPKAVVASGTEDPKVLIISWRTEVHDVQPSDRTSFFPSFWGRGS